MIKPSIPLANVPQVTFDLLVHLQAHQLAAIEFMLSEYSAKHGLNVVDVQDEFHNRVAHFHNLVSTDMIADHGTMSVEGPPSPGAGDDLGAPTT